MKLLTGGYVPPRRARSNLSAVLFALIVGVLAIFCGLIASSGSLIGVAVAVGILLGGMLLARLDIAVWLVLAGTLLINGIFGLAFHSLSKAAWLLSLLGFFLLGGAMLTALLRRQKQSPLPEFIRLFIVFMGVSLAISLTGKGGVLEVLVGAKRTFQLWGLMLVIAMMPISDESNNRIIAWCKFAFLLGFIQLPVALFERLVLVPMRAGMKGGVVAIDIVSGTFESSLDGGGSSSTMIMFLIVLLAYTLAAWRERIFSRTKAMVFSVIFFAPMFLGETKLALVLLPTMILMIFGKELRNTPVKAIAAIIFGFLVTSLLAWLYLTMMRTGSVTLEQQYEKMIAYNFGDVGYYDRYSVNRTTAITFWYKQHGLSDPVATVFGHGIGSSYSGAGSLAPGHLSLRYPFMAINLTGLSTLLWDTGLLGTSLFLLGLYLAWRKSNQLLKIVSFGEERARIEALRVSLMCIVFSLMYSNSMFSALSHECLIAFTFGYLAWISRAKLGSDKEVVPQP